MRRWLVEVPLLASMLIVLGTGSAGAQGPVERLFFSASLDGIIMGEPFPSEPNGLLAMEFQGKGEVQEPQGVVQATHTGTIHAVAPHWTPEDNGSLDSWREVCPPFTLEPPPPGIPQTQLVCGAIPFSPLLMQLRLETAAQDQIDLELRCPLVGTLAEGGVLGLTGNCVIFGPSLKGSVKVTGTVGPPQEGSAVTLQLLGNVTCFDRALCHNLNDPL